MGVLVRTLVFLMQVHSFLLRPLLTCTAGERTLLLPPSFSLTDKTDSPSVKVRTSMLFSHSSTTHVPRILVSTFTPSPFALKSTSHLAHATSPELTMLPFSLFFLLEQLAVFLQPR